MLNRIFAAPTSHLLFISFLDFCFLAGQRGTVFKIISLHLFLEKDGNKIYDKNQGSKGYVAILLINTLNQYRVKT